MTKHKYLVQRSLVTKDQSADRGLVRELERIWILLDFNYFHSELYKLIYKMYTINVYLRQILPP